MNWAITLANDQVQRERREEAKWGECGALEKDKRSHRENVHVCVLGKDVKKPGQREKFAACSSAIALTDINMQDFTSTSRQ